MPVCSYVSSPECSPAFCLFVFFNLIGTDVQVSDLLLVSLCYCISHRHHTDNYHHYHHQHISVMDFGHLLTRSGLMYPEVSSKVCQVYFCLLENSVSLPWVIHYEAFYLHLVSSFSCTPVICPNLVLFLIPLKFVYFFLICQSVSCCSHIFHLCCYYSSGVPCFNSPSFATI